MNSKSDMVKKPDGSSLTTAPSPAQSLPFSAGSEEQQYVQNRRILIVDDDPIARGIFRTYFTQRGATHVAEAEHGVQALKRKERQGHANPEQLCRVRYTTIPQVVRPSTGTAAASHYRCNTAHTAGATFAGDSANWDQIDMADATYGFGSTIQYSPWTDDKARLISNAGADPARAGRLPYSNRR